MTDARRALLDRLIDHAALFPPASLSLADALAEDARARASSDGWVVGRFVAPLSRLPDTDGADVRLAVVLDADLASNCQLLARLDPRVEAVEARPGIDPELVRGAASEVYVELPAELDRLAALGLRAKVRCGGARIPSVEELADVVRGCREHGLVLEATAGLHHAVRRGGEHGFLNLLAAVAFPGAEEAALADEDPSSFALEPRRFAWRDLEIDGAEAARLRREAFAGFGSCSVAEPVEELRALGMLE